MKVSDYLTTPQAREMLGLSRSQFTHLAGKRGWPKQWLGGSFTYYRRADIEAELEGRNARPPVTGARTAERIDAAQTQERNCMRCGQSFGSTHKGNRLCPQCNLVARSLRSSLDF